MQSVLSDTLIMSGGYPTVLLWNKVQLSLFLMVTIWKLINCYGNKSNKLYLFFWLYASII
ncbi:hypothetical protein GSbR_33220 [Geobacter sp. SVR]|nr:hypothetical protein GSbR_33220 [Geobacter sp. SVR]